MENLFSVAANYVLGLDWTYIMTFILIAYMINAEKVRNGLVKIIPVKVQTRYRVVFVGAVWGAFLFYIREYTFSQVEVLLNSFVFALFFHKIIIDAILSRLAPKEPTPDQFNQEP